MPDFKYEYLDQPTPDPYGTNDPTNTDRLPFAGAYIDLDEPHTTGFNVTQFPSSPTSVPFYDPSTRTPEENMRFRNLLLGNARPQVRTNEFGRPEPFNFQLDDTYNKVTLMGSAIEMGDRNREPLSIDEATAAAWEIANIYEATTKSSPFGPNHVTSKAMDLMWSYTQNDPNMFYDPRLHQSPSEFMKLNYSGLSGWVQQVYETFGGKLGYGVSPNDIQFETWKTLIEHKDPRFTPDANIEFVRHFRLANPRLAMWADAQGLDMESAVVNAQNALAWTHNINRLIAVARERGAAEKYYEEVGGLQQLYDSLAWEIKGNPSFANEIMLAGASTVIPGAPAWVAIAMASKFQKLSKVAKVASKVMQVVDKPSVGIIEGPVYWAGAKALGGLGKVASNPRQIMGLRLGAMMVEGAVMNVNEEMSHQQFMMEYNSITGAGAQLAQNGYDIGRLTAAGAMGTVAGPLLFGGLKTAAFGVGSLGKALAGETPTISWKAIAEGEGTFDLNESGTILWGNKTSDGRGMLGGNLLDLGLAELGADNYRTGAAHAADLPTMFAMSGHSQYVENATDKDLLEAARLEDAIKDFVGPTAILSEDYVPKKLQLLSGRSLGEIADDVKALKKQLVDNKAGKPYTRNERDLLLQKLIHAQLTNDVAGKLGIRASQIDARYKQLTGHDYDPMVVGSEVARAAAAGELYTEVMLNDALTAANEPNARAIMGNIAVRRGMKSDIEGVSHVAYFAGGKPDDFVVVYAHDDGSVSVSQRTQNNVHGQDLPDRIDRHVWSEGQEASRNRIANKFLRMKTSDVPANRVIDIAQLHVEMNTEVRLLEADHAAALADVKAARETFELTQATEYENAIIAGYRLAKWDSRLFKDADLPDELAGWVQRFDNLAAQTTEFSPARAAEASSISATIDRIHREMKSRGMEVPEKMRRYPGKDIFSDARMEPRIEPAVSEKLRAKAKEMGISAEGIVEGELEIQTVRDKWLYKRVDPEALAKQQGVEPNKVEVEQDIVDMVSTADWEDDAAGSFTRMPTNRLNALLQEDWNGADSIVVVVDVSGQISGGKLRASKPRTASFTKDGIKAELARRTKQPVEGDAVMPSKPDPISEEEIEVLFPAERGTAVENRVAPADAEAPGKGPRKSPTELNAEIREAKAEVDRINNTATDPRGPRIFETDVETGVQVPIKRGLNYLFSPENNLRSRNAGEIFAQIGDGKPKVITIAGRPLRSADFLAEIDDLPPIRLDPEATVAIQQIDDVINSDPDLFSRADVRFLIEEGSDGLVARVVRSVGPRKAAEALSERFGSDRYHQISRSGEITTHETGYTERRSTSSTIDESLANNTRLPPRQQDINRFLRNIDANTKPLDAKSLEEDWGYTKEQAEIVALLIRMNQTSAGELTANVRLIRHDIVQKFGLSLEDLETLRQGKARRKAAPGEKLSRAQLQELQPKPIDEWDELDYAGVNAKLYAAEHSGLDPKSFRYVINDDIDDSRGQYKIAVASDLMPEWVYRYYYDDSHTSGMVEAGWVTESSPYIVNMEKINHRVDRVERAVKLDELFDEISEANPTLAREIMDLADANPFLKENRDGGVHYIGGMPGLRNTFAVLRDGKWAIVASDLGNFVTHFEKSYGENVNAVQDLLTAFRGSHNKLLTGDIDPFVKNADFPRSLISGNDIIQETLHQQAGPVPNRASIMFRNFGEASRAFMRANGSHDISSIVHEWGHLLEKALLQNVDDAMRNLKVERVEVEDFVKWINGPDAVTKKKMPKAEQVTIDEVGNIIWPDTQGKLAREKFAMGFEKFVRDHLAGRLAEAPGNGLLQNLFERLAKWLTEVYKNSSTLDGINITPAADRIYTALSTRYQLEPNGVPEVDAIAAQIRGSLDPDETEAAAQSAKGAMHLSNRIAETDDLSDTSEIADVLLAEARDNPRYGDPDAPEIREAWDRVLKIADVESIEDFAAIPTYLKVRMWAKMDDKDLIAIYLNANQNTRDILLQDMNARRVALLKAADTMQRRVTTEEFTEGRVSPAEAPSGLRADETTPEAPEAKPRVRTLYDAAGDRYEVLKDGTTKRRSDGGKGKAAEKSLKTVYIAEEDAQKLVGVKITDSKGKLNGSVPYRDYPSEGMVPVEILPGNKTWIGQPLTEVSTKKIPRFVLTEEQKLTVAEWDKAHREQILRSASRYARGDWHEAENAYGKVLESIYAGARDFDKLAENPPAMLYKMTEDRLTDSFRRKRNTEDSIQASEGRIEDTVGVDDPEIGVDSMIDLLNRALDNEQEALFFYGLHVDKRSIQDAAASVGWTLDQGKKRIPSITEKLKNSKVFQDRQALMQKEVDLGQAGIAPEDFPLVNPTKTEVSKLLRKTVLLRGIVTAEGEIFIGDANLHHHDGLRTIAGVGKTTTLPGTQMKVLSDAFAGKHDFFIDLDHGVYPAYDPFHKLPKKVLGLAKAQAEDLGQAVKEPTFKQKLMAELKTMKGRALADELNYKEGLRLGESELTLHHKLSKMRKSKAKVTALQQLRRQLRLTETFSDKEIAAAVRTIKGLPSRNAAEMEEATVRWIKGATNRMLEDMPKGQRLFLERQIAVATGDISTKLRIESIVKDTLDAESDHFTGMTEGGRAMYLKHVAMTMAENQAGFVEADNIVTQALGTMGIGKKVKTFMGHNVLIGDTLYSEVVAMAAMARFFLPQHGFTRNLFISATQPLTYDWVSGQANLRIASNNVWGAQKALMNTAGRSGAIPRVNNLIFRYVNDVSRLPQDAPHRKEIIDFINAVQSYNKEAELDMVTAGMLKKEDMTPKDKSNEFGFIHRTTAEARRNLDQFIEDLTNNQKRKWKNSGVLHLATIYRLGWADIKVDEDLNIQRFTITEDSPLAEHFPDMVGVWSPLSAAQKLEYRIKTEAGWKNINVAEATAARYEKALVGQTDDYPDWWKSYWQKRFPEGRSALDVEMEVAAARYLGEADPYPKAEGMQKNYNFVNWDDNYQRVITHAELVEDPNLMRHFEQEGFQLVKEYAAKRGIDIQASIALKENFGKHITMRVFLRHLRAAVKSQQNLTLEQSQSMDRGLEQFELKWNHATGHHNYILDGASKPMAYAAEHASDAALMVGGSNVAYMSLLNEVPRTIFASDPGRRWYQQFIPSLFKALEVSVSADKRQTILAMVDGAKAIRSITSDRSHRHYGSDVTDLDNYAYTSGGLSYIGRIREAFFRPFSTQYEHTGHTKGMMTKGLESLALIRSSPARWLNEIIEVVHIHNAMHNFDRNLEGMLEMNRLMNKINKAEAKNKSVPELHRDFNRLARQAHLGVEEARELQTAGTFGDHIRMIKRAVEEVPEIRRDGLFNLTRAAQWARTLPDAERLEANKAIGTFSAYVQGTMRNLTREPTLLDVRVAQTPFGALMKVFMQFQNSSTIQGWSQIGRSGPTEAIRRLAFMGIMESITVWIMAVIRDEDRDWEDLKQELMANPKAMFTQGLVRVPLFGSWGWVLQGILGQYWKYRRDAGDTSVPYNSTKGTIPGLGDNYPAHILDKLYGQGQDLIDIILKFDRGEGTELDRVKAERLMPFRNFIIGTELMRSFDKRTPAEEALRAQYLQRTGIKKGVKELGGDVRQPKIVGKQARTEGGAPIERPLVIPKIAQVPEVTPANPYKQVAPTPSKKLADRLH